MLNIKFKQNAGSGVQFETLQFEQNYSITVNDTEFQTWACQLTDEQQELLAKAFLEPTTEVSEIFSTGHVGFDYTGSGAVGYMAGIIKEGGNQKADGLVTQFTLLVSGVRFEYKKDGNIFYLGSIKNGTSSTEMFDQMLPMIKDVVFKLIK